MSARTAAALLAIGVFQFASASWQVQSGVVVVVDVPRDASAQDLSALAGAVRQLPAGRVSKWYLLTEEGASPAGRDEMVSALDALVRARVPGRISVSEAAQMAAGNEAVRDQVISRACGAQSAGCGPALHAEAVALLEDVDTSAAARLRALAALSPGASDELILVTPGFSYRSIPRDVLDGAAARLATERVVQVVRAGSLPRPIFTDAVDALASRVRLEIVAIDRLAQRGPPPAPSPSAKPLSGIPAAVQAYAGRFQQTMRFVIAQEHYEQTVRLRAGSYNLPITSPGVIVQRRNTDAEVALLHLAEDVWMMTRRVERVDGRVVPSPTRRPAQPSTEAEAIAELKRTAQEAARWNIGPSRNINTPTLALWFLTPRFADRFRVAAAGSDRVKNRVLSVLRFTEVAQPPLMQVDGHPVPASGRIWVDPQSGVVAKTELILERTAETNSDRVVARGVTVVTYAPAEKFDCWVPAEMRESYDFPANRSGDMLATVATYSHYRRFSVETRIK